VLSVPRADSLCHLKRGTTLDSHGSVAAGKGWY
jgi:hypothetical protein